MKAIEQYLKRVGGYLPKGEKEDVLQELSENIRSEISTRETELGRGLSEAEVKLVLQRLGDPLRVAAGYRREERTLAFGRRLVGPVLFPVYARVLKINLSLTLLACIVVSVALRGPASVLHSIPATLAQLALQFVIVTVIFMAAEIAQARNQAIRWEG